MRRVVELGPDTQIVRQVRFRAEIEHRAGVERARRTQ
jgi:hypothetical protein